MAGFGHLFEGEGPVSVGAKDMAPFRRYQMSLITYHDPKCLGSMMREGRTPCEAYSSERDMGKMIALITAILQIWKELGRREHHALEA